MRTIKLVTFCLLVASFSPQRGIAQDIGPGQMERFKAQKIAYFTQNLRLTPKESEKFWPVYNEYQEKRNEILMEKRKTTVYIRQNIKTMTDKELEKTADSYVLFESKLADLLTTYHQKFKEVLPIRKVLKLYQTENQFKTFLLKQIRDNQKRRNPRMNPNRNFNQP